MLKIAVTGGVATGKSTFCRFFQEKGAFVVNADLLVHQFLSSATELGKKVIELLGPEIVVNNILNREKIAALVFNNKTKLDKLEKLLHPALLRKIELLYEQVKDDPAYSCFVVEMPLLHEIGAEKFYDITIAITAKEALCVNRFTKTGFAARQGRMRSQEKLKKADFVVENNGSSKEFKQTFNILYRRLSLHEPRKQNPPSADY